MKKASLIGLALVFLSSAVVFAQAKPASERLRLSTSVSADTTRSPP